jgi:hypothetical protein
MAPRRVEQVSEDIKAASARAGKFKGLGDKRRMRAEAEREKLLSAQPASRKKKAKKPKKRKQQKPDGGGATVIELYHGTSRAHAVAMAAVPPNPGTIDVTRGRGEFGRGFYTQDSVANAFRRGQVLYGNTAAILVVAIDSHAYHALSFKRLTYNAAKQLDAKLTGNGTRHTYTTAQDVIVGPLVSQPSIMQQKFQTANAQTLLNGPQTQRTVRP